MPREKIEVTVVRNDKENQEVDSKSGLFIPKALPHYDIKKIVGAADVRLETRDGEAGAARIKAFLVGSQLSHAELSELCTYSKTYEITILDGQR
jgi:hypothetical protein